VLTELEPRIVLSQAPLTPPEIAHAYAFDQIKLPGGYAANGQGQTIAIIEIGDTPMSAITTALTAFDAGDAADGLGYSLPAVPHLLKVDLSGGADAGTELETLLDVEWVHALAPAANIIIFEAAPGSNNDQAQTLANFMTAVSDATHYNGTLGQVSVVSMSYGFHEDQIPADSLATYDAIFTTPANHIGITFVASAGDDGAGFQERYPNDLYGSDGNEPPEYPSSSPNVIAVGGTTLIYPNNSTSFGYPGVATTADGVGESAWGNGSLSFFRSDSPGGGSGGGISLFESEPSYQSNHGLAYSNGSFNARTTPDVSFDADFNNSPVLIYDSYDTDLFGQPIGWTANGGTSFAAPAWAALIAIADEGRAADNESSLDGPTQTLPDLYHLSSNDFHDITQGNNGYSAGAGYDLATGLGTPIASRVVADLWGQTSLADLAPYTPSGWSGPLVVSTQSGITTTATTITTAETVYIDWAFINQGSAAITTAFETELLVDGTQVHTWPAGVPLNPNFYTHINDYSLGQLSAGSHTVTVVADYLNQVTESNKNNTISYTFTVTQATLPNLAPYTPKGWSGPLVVSTQSGVTTSASNITATDTVYIDWAFINNGSAAINKAFGVELLLDGTQVETWSAGVPLQPNQYTDVTDYSLGQLATGTHTVTVVADYQHTLTTGSDSDNTETFTFTVTQQALPDLAPYTPSGWSGPLVVSTLSGSTTTTTTISTTNDVYIDWAFINRGNAAINSEYQFELLLDGNSVQTWTGPVPLDPNFYTYFNNFDMGQLAPGSHTVTVVADYLNQVTESNKNNNTETYTFTVTAPGLPDLAPYTPSGWSGPLVVSTVASNTNTAFTITTADNVYVDWAFINQGSAAINNAFGVELLLDGAEVNTWSVSAPLDANYYTYITGYSLGQLTAGSHTITVVADSLNQVTETNKNNNTSTYTFTVAQPALSDLAPYTPSGWSGPLVVSTQSGSTTTSSTITTANNVYIDWAFINQGNATINTTFHTELLLDGVQEHTWYSSPPLGPTIYAFVQNYNLGELTAGSHTITVVANYLKEVTESDDNNNTSTYTFTVTKPALPDLAPYTPAGWSGPLVVSTQAGRTTTASTITTANTIYIDWAFINQGNAPVTTTFYVELLVDGAQVHTWSVGVPLNPNYYTHISDYSLGQLAAGAHTATVVADYTDQVTESNKNNNTASYIFTVTKPALPDLAPYRPTGWSGPLVVSTQAGKTTTAATITTANTIYIDWAFINQGNATITTAFATELLVDGVMVATWTTNPPLQPGSDTFVQNFKLGKLAAGKHTLTVITNYKKQVAESNLTNDNIPMTVTVAKSKR